MYKETLKILMEGIDDPIKEQLLKNQLEYHFQYKTPENKVAIDNSTTIVRRMLEDFEIMDLISVQPIADWNPDCETIRNDEHFDVETNTNGLFFHDMAGNGGEYNGLDMQCEVNHAIASELSYMTTRDIVKKMLKYAPQVDNIIIDTTLFRTQKVDLVKSIMDTVENVDAKWIIVGLSELALITMSDRYTSLKKGFKLIAGVSLDGLIDNDIRVYTSLDISDTIVVGSSDDENPPIVYAPETLLVVGDFQQDENRFELLTSAETFLDLDAVEERYRKISIIYENSSL